jgi:hypothetical protein
MPPPSKVPLSTRNATQRGATPPPFYVRTNRISCDACRKRKLRCDRVKPCSTCVKRGIAEQCYQEEGQENAGVDACAKRPKDEQAASMSYSKESLQDSKCAEVVLDRSHIASNVAKWKGQMDDIARLASQSSTSLEGMLNDLSSAEGEIPSAGIKPESVSRLQTGQLVVWQDVKDHLPLIEDCEALTAFYFEEVRSTVVQADRKLLTLSPRHQLSSYFRISQRSLFEKQWRSLLDGSGIDRTEAAILFTAFALADIMIPSASLMRRHRREDHHRWMTLLGDPTSSILGEAVDNSLPKIQLLCLHCIHHLYESKMDHLWELIGVAMRKAIIFGLFDERSRSWLGLNNLEREYRRRLAWYMLTLDR